MRVAARKYLQGKARKSMRDGKVTLLENITFPCLENTKMLTSQFRLVKGKFQDGNLGENKVVTIEGESENE